MKKLSVISYKHDKFNKLKSFGYFIKTGKEKKKIELKKFKVLLKNAVLSEKKLQKFDKYVKIKENLDDAINFSFNRFIYISNIRKENKKRYIPFNFFRDYNGLISYKKPNINVEFNYMYLDSYSMYRFKFSSLFDYFFGGNFQFKIKDEFINFVNLKFKQKNLNNFKTQEVFYCDSLVINFQNVLYQDSNLYNFHLSEDNIFKPFFFTNYLNLDLFKLLGSINLVRFQNIFKFKNNTSYFIKFLNLILYNIISQVNLVVIYLKFYILDKFINLQKYKTFVITNLHFNYNSKLLLKNMKKFNKFVLLRNLQKRGRLKDKYLMFFKNKTFFNNQYSSILQRIKYINKVYSNNKYKYEYNVSLKLPLNELNLFEKFKTRNQVIFVASFIAKYNYFWKSLINNINLKKRFVLLSLSKWYIFFIKNLINWFNILKFYIYNNESIINFKTLKLYRILVFYKLIRKKFKVSLKKKIKNLLYVIKKQLKYLNSELYKNQNICIFRKYFFKKYKLNLSTQFDNIQRMLRWFDLDELLSWGNIDFITLYFFDLLKKYKLYELLKLRLIKYKWLDYTDEWKFFYSKKLLLSKYLFRWIYFKKKVRGKYRYFINKKEKKVCYKLIYKFDFRLKKSLNNIIYKKWHNLKYNKWI